MRNQDDEQDKGRAGIYLTNTQRVLLVGVVLIVLVVILGSLSGDSESTESAGQDGDQSSVSRDDRDREAGKAAESNDDADVIPTPTTAPKPTATPMVHVSAPKLYAEMERNAVATLRRYEDTPILVTGTVVEVKHDIFGAPNVNLATGDFWNLRCRFPPEREDQVLDLVVEQEVTLKAILVGTDLGGTMEHCELVN